jgi:cyclopropane fatty-acyl-phospholipid synthase-like methyltransferase
MEKLIGNNGERTTPNQLSTFEFERIYKYVSKLYGDKHKIILDYGSGSGYETKICSEYFQKSYGVDVSEDAVNFSNNNYSTPNLTYKLLNPNSKPFEDQSFDYIFSFQVFEHISQNYLPLYIEFIYKMLKKNGVAIITTPNSYNYYRGFSGNVHHVKEYNYDELYSFFIEILPDENFNIFFVEDILSTRIRLKIKKYFKNAFGRVLGGGLVG